jgi:TPR repeat protein
MSEIQRSPFRWILLAATILTVLATPSLPADIRTLRKQAEAGDAKARFNIGSMYENGVGVRQDYAEAAKWYRKAAEQGDVEAARILGLAYYLGKWVPQDLVAIPVIWIGSSRELLRPSCPPCPGLWRISGNPLQNQMIE